MEIDFYYAQYAERFGDGFPSYQLARGRTDDEVIDIIKRCLAEGKDAYALGLVTDDLDVLY